jgi:hypothetical protein
VKPRHRGGPGPLGLLRHGKNKQTKRDCRWLNLHAFNTRQVIVNVRRVDTVLDNSLQGATMDPFGRITFLLRKEKFIIIIIIIIIIINCGNLLYPVQTLSNTSRYSSIQNRISTLM